MTNMLWFLTVIPSLVLLVFVHELGHFLTAIKMGIKVEEFGFGYPPRALTLFHYKGVPITLNWLPLGGFVRMAGEEGNFEQEGSLAAAPPWRKIPVMAAGAVMNLITAVVLFAIVGMAGTPETLGPLTIQNIVPDSPAAEANLQIGDVILAVDGQPIDSFMSLRARIDDNLGQPTTMDIQRQEAQSGGDPLTRTLQVRLTPRTLEQRAANEGAIGVEAIVPEGQSTGMRYANRLGLLSAVGFGFAFTWDVLVQMIAALGGLLVSLFGMAPQQQQGGVTGLIGIGRLTGEVARTGGLIEYLRLTAIISVNLALFNLLPIPALDGSRIVFALIEWLRRGKRVPPEKEAMVHAIGMMALLGLMLLVTFSDIRNIFLGRDAFGN